MPKANAVGRYEMRQHWLSRQWRWRFVASNGRVIAISSEGYWNRIECLQGITLLKNSGNAPVKT